MRGFTLLEIIVAVSVFSVAVGAIVSLLTLGMRGQRNAVSRQNILENTRFAIEHMARQVRMAQRDENGSCLGAGASGSTFALSGSSLTFLDYRNPPKCVTYGLEGEKIVMRPDTGRAFDDLTSDDVVVRSLTFILRGVRKDDSEQPRVTIAIEAVASGVNPESAPTLRLQTTISGRNLDVL